MLNATLCTVVLAMPVMMAIERIDWAWRFRWAWWADVDHVDVACCCWVSPYGMVAGRYGAGDCRCRRCTRRIGVKVLGPRGFPIIWRTTRSCIAEGLVLSGTSGFFRVRQAPVMSEVAQALGVRSTTLTPPAQVQAIAATRC